MDSVRSQAELFLDPSGISAGTLRLPRIYDNHFRSFQDFEELRAFERLG